MNQPVSGGQNDKFAVSKLLPDSNNEKTNDLLHFDFESAQQ